MPLWAVCIPLVFSLGVLVGALIAARPGALSPDVHALDTAYRCGLSDGLCARTDEVAYLESMVAGRS